MRIAFGVGRTLRTRHELLSSLSAIEM